MMMLISYGWAASQGVASYACMLHLNGICPLYDAEVLLLLSSCKHNKAPYVIQLSSHHTCQGQNHVADLQQQTCDCAS